jgi:hypothetical protein
MSVLQLHPNWCKLVAVGDPVIERDEVVALLFNVSDIAATLSRMRQLMEGDDGEEEADEE